MRSFLLIISLLFISAGTSYLVAQCPSCCNGIQDCGETGIDCGGSCVSCVSLVPNGGFDCISSCPTQEGTIAINSLALAIPWDYVGFDGHPDLFNTCFVSGPNWQCGVPVNTWGDQLPFNGEGYAGFLACSPFEDDKRDYVQVPLNNVLSSGINYELTFFVSLADNYQYAIDEIGAYFSVGAQSNPDYLPMDMYGIAPHITSPIGPGQEIIDKVNWVPISGSYMASGGEDHLIIGNFKWNWTNNMINIGTGSREVSYYFLDSIRVVPSVPLGQNSMEIEGSIDGEKVSVSWKDEFPNFGDSYILQMGKLEGSYSDVLKAPYLGENTFSHQIVLNEPGELSFRVIKKDQNGLKTKSTSLVLEIDDIENNLTIFQPFGSESIHLRISRFSDSPEADIKFFNLEGKELKSVKMEWQPELIIELGDLPKGIHFIKVSNGKKTTTKRFLIN